MYQFTEDCYIGIPEIDQEHQYLFQLINEAMEGLQTKGANAHKATQELLKKLVDYAAVHFAHEEAYMESTKDPELSSQRREHTAFTKKVQKMMRQEHFTQESYVEILEFLTRWLYRHILSSDMMIGKMSHVTRSEEKENPFAFTDEYLTGIPLVDEEHRHLFDIIGRTNELVHDEMVWDKYDGIVEIIQELQQYTQEHFNDEEAYMESIHYQGLDAQRRAHNAFIDKIADISFEELDDIDENQQEYLEGLIDFLAGWLINHILKMDKLIG